MSTGQSREWWKPAVIVAVATFMLSFATFWLTFAIGYTGNHGFRSWVDSSVALLGPFSAKGLGLFTGAVVSLLFSALVVWIKRRAERSNWRERWKQWRTERYASALQSAAGPVRDQLAAKLCDGTVKGYSSADRIEQAGSDALQVLLAALLQYDASASERVVLVPGDLWLEGGGKGVERSVEALMRGCRELERAGFVESWRDWEGAGVDGVEVMLGEPCVPRRVAADIRWRIERVLVERGVWEEN